jgi:adenylyltransferase/sulfurtransferase
MTVPVTTIDPTDVKLTHEEVLRYSRHLILPDFGMEGQKKLKASSVLLIGTGGLGSPLALYLAAAGVGRIGLVDYDVVDYTNLQRQVIHGTKDVGRSKLESTSDTLADINPFVHIDQYNTLLTSANALEILAPYDIIIDGTDNFPTRYLVNDASILLGKINVYGSIFRFEGQVTVFGAEDGPCYRCLFPEPPPPGLVPSCAEGGVLGVLPGTIGTLQATEAIKILAGIGEPLVGRLLLYDALNMTFDTLKIRKNPMCPICGDHRTVTELIDYEQFCGLPAHDRSEEDAKAVPSIGVKALKDKVDAGEDFVIVDVREAHELQISQLDGAIHIPKGEVLNHLDQIPQDTTVIALCRTGVRSGEVVGWLMERGYTNAYNLVGGINAWARQIDESLPVY